MSRKKTVEEVIQQSKDNHGSDTYDYSLFTEYLGNKIPFTLICNKHGKEFNVTANDHNGKKKSGCPICGLENRQNRVSTTTFQEFESKVKELHGDKYTCIDNLKTYGVKDYATVVCPDHGEFKKQIQELYRVREGRISGCPECNLQTKRLDYHSLAKVRLNEGNHYSYDKINFSTIKNIKEPLTFTCPHHGDFIQSFEAHFFNNHNCRVCSHSFTTLSIVKSIDDLITKSSSARDFSNKQIVFLSDQNLVVNTIIKNIKCIKHNTIYDQTYFQLREGYIGCSKCKTTTSKTECEIFDYVVSLLKDKNIEAHQSYRKIKDITELDIYIPDLKFGIEYNGTAFHHSSYGSDISNFFLSTKKDKSYHFDKWLSCKNNGITLLSIYDFYWNDLSKQNIIKSKIRHYLQLDKKVYARKCKIISVPNEEAYSFYKINHLEGAGLGYKDSKSFALEYNGIKYMYCTIGDMYNQSTKTFKTKLHRICTLLDYTVVGGVSKLSKFLTKQFGNFSYQITLSSGGSSVLFSSGIKYISPRYFWVNPADLKYYHRNTTQKQNLFKNFGVKVLDSDTENSYMERLGYLKVFDNGLAEIQFK